MINEKQKNLLVLCYEFPPIGGGGGKVVLGLSKELVKIGFNIDIVTMRFKELPLYEKFDGLNIYRVPCIRKKESVCLSHEMGTYIINAIPIVKTLVKNNKYHLNHTHFIFPDGLISNIVKKATGLPYLITAHGSDVPGYNPDRFQIQHEILNPIWKRVIANSSGIVCPSETIRNLILKRKPDTKTFLVPNGIKISKFNHTRKKKNRILVVTRMIKRKGVQYILDALSGLSIDYEVNIVGDGPYLQNLKAFSEKKNVKVNFCGWMDNSSPELKELYETSKIFVFPSEAENFPIVLLEAMAAGLAIITTKNTGCAEVVGDSAILVNPRDSEGIKLALTELAESSTLCNRLSAKARNRLEENFSWGKIAKQYSNIFKRQIYIGHADFVG